MPPTAVPKTTITKNTRIPLSIAFALGTALVTIVLWASNIAARADQANERLDQLEEQRAVLYEIQTRVAKVETRVDLIYDAIQRHADKR